MGKKLRHCRTAEASFDDPTRYKLAGTKTHSVRRVTVCAKCIDCVSSPRDDTSELGLRCTACEYKRKRRLGLTRYRVAKHRR